MVEGHRQHLLDGEPLLVRPRQQVREVLGPRRDHLRAQKAACFPLGVDVHRAAVLEHHPGASLVLKRHPADDRAAILDLRPALAHHRDVGIGERHRDRRGPVTWLHGGEPRRVLPGDAAFVGGFVQQRHVGVGVSREEDRALAALHRARVVDRHAAPVTLQARALQTEPIDVGHTPRRSEHVVNDLAAERPGVVPSDAHAFGDAHHLGHPRIGVQRQLGGKNLPRVLADLRVGERSDQAANAKDAYAHPEAMQRLTELKADDAGAEHRD